MEEMTSMMYDRRHGGSMQVFNATPVNEIITDGEAHARAMSSACTRTSPMQRQNNGSRRAFSTPNPRLRASNTVDPETLLHHTLKLQEWLNERSVKAVQEKADTEAKATKRLYDAVLETENTFVKDMQNVVRQNQTNDLRKKEILHKKWNEHVYQPIRNQIDKEMSGPMYPELDRRKRQLYKEYIEHVNKKGHVFLDTIAPDEYYPLALHPVRPAFLTAETRQLKDPLLSQGKERNREDRLVFRCMTGSTLSEREMDSINLPRLPLVPLGRHGTDCRSWLAMPMGDIESPVRQMSRRRMYPAYNDTHFAFSTWGKECSQSIVDAEMAIQKKKMYNPDVEFIDMEKTPRSPKHLMSPNVAVQCDS